MALTCPNQGEDLALKAILNNTAPQDLDLCLYANNLTLTETVTEASVTAVTDNGGAPIQLTAANWSFTPGAPSTADYAKQTFTFSAAPSAGATMYGYYIKQRTSGKLLWIEAFNGSTGWTVGAGDKIEVTLNVSIG
jgi:hypothetical protein